MNETIALGGEILRLRAEVQRLQGELDACRRTKSEIQATLTLSDEGASAWANLAGEQRTRAEAAESSRDALAREVETLKAQLAATEDRTVAYILSITPDDMKVEVEANLRMQMQSWSAVPLDATRERT